MRLHQFIILSALVSLLLGCESEAKKEKENSVDADKKGSNSEVGTKNSQADQSRRSSSNGYKAKLGDIYLALTQSKSWTSDVAEPNYDPAEESLHEVVAVYKNRLSCSHRSRVDTAGVSTYSDEGCKEYNALSCGTAEIDAETDCSSKSIEKITVNEFKDAKGKEETCRTVTHLDNDTVSISKTINREWKHRKALKKDRIVKWDTQTCAIVIPDADYETDTEVDPCRAGDETVASMSRQSWEIKEQKHGPGGVRHTEIEEAKLVIDDIDSSTKVSKTVGLTCVVEGERLRISAQKSACREETLQNLSVTVSDLPISETSNASLIEAQVTFAAGAGPLTTEDHQCSITVSKDNYNQMIYGKLDCTNNYDWEGNLVTLSGLEFRCHAPNGYSDFNIDPEKPFAGKHYSSAGSGNSGQNGTSGNDQTGSTGSDSGIGGNQTGDNQGNDNQGASNNNNDSGNTANNSGGSSSSNVNSNQGNSGGSSLPTDGQIVFVSSYTSQGGMNYGGAVGRAGADARCTEAARNSSLGLTGNFRAILSNDASDARDHARVMGTVYNTNGDVVAANSTEFFGTIRSPMSYDENGVDRGAVHVHTGSRPNATHHYSRSCFHWERTNASITRTNWGVANRLDGSRFKVDDDRCTKQAHVYCMQQR